MIDPRGQAVLILDSGVFKDKTSDVTRYEYLPGNQRVAITFTSGKTYPFGLNRVRILHNTARYVVSGHDQVEIDGSAWHKVTEILTFGGEWTHVFYGGGEKYASYPAAKVRVLTSATAVPRTGDVLRYWRAIVDRLPADDPLRWNYERLAFIHPESALAAYLAGAPIRARQLDAAPIFPFRSNLSQRAAVENALTRSVSVIEGPPGTGKTETILNLIANIVAVHHQTVGIVSFNNAAVDNVRDKLDELGFGHVLGNLGRKEKRAEFFSRQAERAGKVARFVAAAPPPPEDARLADLDRRLRAAQEDERVRADRRQSLDAHRLQLRHFEDHVQRGELPDLEKYALLKKPADRILDYLAESRTELVGGRPGLVRRIGNYFRYGPRKGLDPGDTGTVLRLELAYFTQRIAELEREIDLVENRLRRADFDRISQEHQRLSTDFLHAALAERYRRLGPSEYQADTYRRGKTFQRFIADHPAVLSTCHSLRPSLADGHLLDYLIIDEASQVHLLAAGLAMSCARNVVVVGDQKQLQPILDGTAAEIPSPLPPYDVKRHNLLSSLDELYGDHVPKVLLREHYRCDPVIIGFCNRAFYGNDLIPYTRGGAERPMVVYRTSEGNHMRVPGTGSRSNQRELDVITQEVIPALCHGVADTDIGITTPYRLQANKAGDLLAQIEADTVHKFQGRQKQVVVLTTVLNDNPDDLKGMEFVDDPHMINVAVSRAIRRFVLVTNNGLMPGSRHIQDLVGYIQYHHPDDVIVDSTVVSVFDLLYNAYSQRLRAFSARVKRTDAQDSEDIIQTVLNDVFAERRYEHMTAVSQMLLRDLLPHGNLLTPEQAGFVGRRASLDFVVYNKITNQPRLVVEVDGYGFHENDPVQLGRDAVKDAILRTYRMPLLRLPTTGSGEHQRVRDALDNAEAHWATWS